MSRNERDISWLAFNQRVLQESTDRLNPLHERLRFLGIFSNNLDEFYRVRVPLLKKLAENKIDSMIKKKAIRILHTINETLSIQKEQFEIVFNQILAEMKTAGISLKKDSELNRNQKQFVVKYFEEHVRTFLNPLMIESIDKLPTLSETNLYLACLLGNKNLPMHQSYALIEVPADIIPRFIKLPTKTKEDYILLEDIIRFCMPQLFGQFAFDHFNTSIIKITKDSDLDLDNEYNADFLQKIEQGIKKRKTGNITRFIYEDNLDKRFLKYLLSLLKMKKTDNVIKSGSIHNSKDFMNFPQEAFVKKDVSPRKPSIIHPKLKQPVRIIKVLEEQDILLHIPYHSFDSIIDLLREASIDPYVEEIYITCYRLAPQSKIANALINAVRNGKRVRACIELRARFDEVANIKWVRTLQEEGVEVITNKTLRKVHAKLCLIKRQEMGVLQYVGFVGTGNLNERTARIYADHFLLTTNAAILQEVNMVFQYLFTQKNSESLRQLKYLLVSPLNTRKRLLNLLSKENEMCIVKLNSLSDPECIKAIRAAIKRGCKVKLIVRGIYCIDFEHDNLEAVSIVDSYLEHSRIIYYQNGKEPIVYLGSADWMVRNLDHRIEVMVPVLDPQLKKELNQYLQLQLSENVKARVLDMNLSNQYKSNKAKKVRAQEAIFNVLNKNGKI